MAVEIERKFLVTNNDWCQTKDGSALKSVVFKQGYLPAEEGTVVRVRLEGPQAKLTIKGKTEGIRRLEYEYDIPHQDAEEMLATLCRKPIIEKTRYFRQEGDLTWEIDVFEGVNQGLVVAEIELESESTRFELPKWLGKEVSDDPRYYNVNLIDHPYSKW